MERRIQLAEENSSTKRDLEADELRRELEEARMAERMAKIQLEETRGPLSPSLAPSTATVAGITVRLDEQTYCALLLLFPSKHYQELQMLQLHIPPHLN